MPIPVVLDGPELLRLATAPQAEHDEELAQQMVADVTQPECDVLPQGVAFVEARFGELFRGLLSDDGWNADDPWTPLQRDLAEPVADPAPRIELTGSDQASVPHGGCLAMPDAAGLCCRAGPLRRRGLVCPQELRVWLSGPPDDDACHGNGDLMATLWSGGSSPWSRSLTGSAGRRGCPSNRSFSRS